MLATTILCSKWELELELFAEREARQLIIVQCGGIHTHMHQVCVRPLAVPSICFPGGSGCTEVSKRRGTCVNQFPLVSNYAMSAVVWKPHPLRAQRV